MKGAVAHEQALFPGKAKGAIPIGSPWLVGRFHQGNFFPGYIREETGIIPLQNPEGDFPVPGDRRFCSLEVSQKGFIRRRKDGGQKSGKLFLFRLGHGVQAFL